MVSPIEDEYEQHQGVTVKDQEMEEMATYVLRRNG
jgi:hypothetical protein